MRKVFAVLVSLLIVGIPAPAMATPFTGSGYYYAGGSQTFTGTDHVDGLAANLYVAKPFVPNTIHGGVYDHSLISLAVSKDTTGAAGSAMEAGIVVEPNVFGDFNPHLYACAWYLSTAIGCYTGSTNWIDNTSNSVNLGADLSADIGTSKQFVVYWSGTNCGIAASGWYLKYNGTNVGCYMPSTFNNSFFSSQFVQAFGEYFYNGANNPGTSNDKPCGDMGNGVTPGTGAAYVSSLTLQNPIPSTLVASFTLFTPTDSAAYSAAFTAVTTTRSFYYGGAGYKFVSGVATTPGNVGSC